MPIVTDLVVRFVHPTEPQSSLKLWADHKKPDAGRLPGKADSHICQSAGLGQTAKLSVDRAVLHWIGKAGRLSR